MTLGRDVPGVLCAEPVRWRSIQAFWGEPPDWLRADLEATGAVVRVIAEEPEFGGREDWPAGAGRDRRRDLDVGRVRGRTDPGHARGHHLRVAAHGF